MTPTTIIPSATTIREAPAVLPPAEVMFQALEERDPAFDGLFFACVTSTRIFCRPVCPARKPKRENVEFVATAHEALLAGYRPCLRCHPMDSRTRPPAWLSSLLASIEAHPERRVTDADLRHRSIDPARVRRYFNEHYGMTFHAYHRALRLGRAMACVRAGDDLLAVGGRHGYDSDSGFREAFANLFGVSPGRSRSSEQLCLQARWITTPLGPMLAIASPDGLCLLEFLDRRGVERQIEVVRRRFDAVVVPGSNAFLEQIAAELIAYFDGALTVFRTPLDLRGTPFQLDVWRRLQQIEYGTTSAYSELAMAIGCPGGARAVGRANGDNRLAIIVPCHRVIRADGQLSGYGGGLWRKRWFLEHERQHRENDVQSGSSKAVGH